MGSDFCLRPWLPDYQRCFPGAWRLTVLIAGIIFALIDRRRVKPRGALLSLVAVVILLFTGWKRGERGFRHRVGAVHGVR